MPRQPFYQFFNTFIMELIIHPCPKKNALKLREIAHYSSNIYGVFPKLTIAQCDQMMQEQQSLQRHVLTKNDYEDLSSRLCDFISKCNITQRGCIWFSFHMGPYHILIHLLNKLNGNLAVLVSRQVYDDYNPELRSHRLGKKISLINVQDAAAIWKIKHAMQSGIQLLVYIDGNMGSGLQLKRTVQLPLGQLCWSLSTVLADWASCYQIPVVPIWMFIDEGKRPQLKLGQPHAVTDATAFVKDCFLQFYQDLLRYPAQWKGWLFVHHDVQPTPRNLEKGRRPVCYPDFMPYPLPDQYYLLERSTGLFYAVDAVLYQQICKDMKHELILKFGLI
jgi:hypothetical protein